MNFYPNKTTDYVQKNCPVRYYANNMYLYANICNTSGVQVNENGACPEPPSKPLATSQLDSKQDEKKVKLFSQR
jgi:hypothetical protein